MKQKYQCNLKICFSLFINKSPRSKDDPAARRPLVSWRWSLNSISAKRNQASWEPCLTPVKGRKQATNDSLVSCGKPQRLLGEWGRAWVWTWRGSQWPKTNNGSIKKYDCGGWQPIEYANSHKLVHSWPHFLNSLFPIQIYYNVNFYSKIGKWRKRITKKNGHLDNWAKRRLVIWQIDLEHLKERERERERESREAQQCGHSSPMTPGCLLPWRLLLLYSYGPD